MPGRRVPGGGATLNRAVTAGGGTVRRAAPPSSRAEPRGPVVSASRTRSLRKPPTPVQRPVAPVPSPALEHRARTLKVPSGF
ncbi:MAG: hypothetical protein AVDCRST_MAG59-2987 [uncultured Thermomicrobiales bacterium]|uniref:Uncharacterized protein n=1 Tax=uncultured Thermomicrobiales bacterium TaxID=1645740 RepID=A0A6J4V3I5_9BACT|nr:MAG: hypothetical protein AVDCRST_MAG59-2987 [uncultured Thermomicrobiales bacterium]